jgi:hypothetical protein
MASASKRRYIEEEAAHSGDDTSSGSESSDNEYEKGSFVVSDEDASSSDEDAAVKARAKRVKREADKTAEEAESAAKAIKARAKAEKPAAAAPAPSAAKVEKPVAPPSGGGSKAAGSGAAPTPSVHKPHGNKSLDIRHVPPEPPKVTVIKAKPKFHFCISFTNARYAENFWNVACKALPYLFFHLEVKEDYAGLRLEAHDTPPTMAIKSKMECIVEAGVDAEGETVDRSKLDGEFFCVKSKTLMKCFRCGTLKDTPLKLIKMHGQDGVIFEASSDESDLKTRYLLPFYAKTPSTVLSRINTTSDIQIKMNTNVLQKLADIANSVDAPTVRFDLFEGESGADDSVLRRMLTVYFPGEEIKGSHTFFLSSKKRTIKDGVDEFEPIAEEDNKSIKWKQMSSNNYSSSKFRLFVANLDVKWCLLGLPTERKNKPIVILADSTETGANKTSHAIFISPQHDDEGGE